jgi:hypothetical protein
MAASATETNNEVLGKICQRTAVTPGKSRYRRSGFEASGLGHFGPLFEQRFESLFLQEVVASYERLVASRRVLLRQFKFALLLSDIGEMLPPDMVDCLGIGGEIHFRFCHSQDNLHLRSGKARPVLRRPGRVSRR